jgi:biopolymer transport protein ExbD
MRKALSGPSHEVHVKADRSLEYGQVREVLERIHQAGAARVALGTNERGEGKK